MELVINQDHPQQDLQRDREYQLERRWYQFAKPLIPRASAGQTLIDIGGGAGEFAAYTRELGYDTTLVDGNVHSVKRELKRGFKAMHADFNSGLSAIPDASFDVAVCLEVIEHIVPAEQLLREIRRVLKPEGFLVLSTPNFACARDRIGYLFGRDLLCEGYHYRFFTAKRLAASFSECGFSIQQRNSPGSALGINFILRMISLGHLRIPHFRVPEFLESFLASTLLYKAVCR